MALQNSYDSKLTKLINIGEIVSEIKKAKLIQSPHYITKGFPLIVEGMNVQPFMHPIYSPETGEVYSDARSYLTEDRLGAYKVISLSDQELSDTRAVLELAWVSDKNKDKVWSAFAFANRVFINWFSDLLSHRMGLDAEKQNKMRALVCIYTIGLYFNNMSEAELLRMADNTARNNAIPREVIRSVVAGLDNTYPRDIDEFVSAVEASDFGPRASGFSVATIYNMLNNSWFISSNTSQIVALACEYPPAFASLVYIATNNPMFKRSLIAGACDKLNRQDNYVNYQRSIKLLIETYQDGE